MDQFIWKAAYFEPLVALSVFAFGFLTYLVIYLYPGLEVSLKERHGSEQGRYWWVVIIKMAGFVLLGLLPVFIVLFVFDKNLGDYGIRPIETDSTYYWMFGGSAVILFITFLHGRSPAGYHTYPLIRHRLWTWQTLAVSLTTSALFIIGYEFMFRAFLLFACLEFMGPWLAIAINVVIYALAHIHKGLTETIGSIPLGILFCWIVLSTGNIWAILAMHLCLTLATDIFALWANPEMRFAGVFETKNR